MRSPVTTPPQRRFGMVARKPASCPAATRYFPCACTTHPRASALERVETGAENDGGFGTVIAEAFYFCHSERSRGISRYYAAETGGADAGLRSEAMTSGRIFSSSTGVNFDSPFGYAIRVCNMVMSVNRKRSVIILI